MDGFVGGHPFRFAVQHLRHLRRVREIRPGTAGGSDGGRRRRRHPSVPDFRGAPDGGNGVRPTDSIHGQRHTREGKRGTENNARQRRTSVRPCTTVSVRCGVRVEEIPRVATLQRGGGGIRFA